MKTPAVASARPPRGPLLAALLVISLAGHWWLAVERTESGAPPTDAPPPAGHSKATPPEQMPAAPGAVTPELRAYAALGSYVAASNRIPDLGWTEAQFAAFVEGMRAAYGERPYPFDEDAQQLRQSINTRVQEMLGRTGSDPVEEYFSTLREKEGVQRTGSNLHYRITMEGDGVQPRGEDIVVVSYAARLPSGEALPELSGERVRVKVNDLLPGLGEGLHLLRPGGKALLYLPPALSFGSGRWPDGVPPGAPVAFFVELHEVVGEEW